MNAKPVRNDDTPRRRLITASIFGALGCVFAGTGIWIWMAGLELSNKGVKAQATILSKFTKRRYSKSSNSLRSDIDYHVRYQFKALSGRHRDRKVVSSGFYNSVKFGDRVPVRYLPRDPSINEIEARTFSTNALIASGFGAVFFVFAIIVLLMPKKRTARYQKDESDKWGRTAEPT